MREDKFRAWSIEKQAWVYFGIDNIPSWVHPAEVEQYTGLVKYCDRCKWDSERCSKGIPDGMEVDDMTNCPDCGRELYEVDRVADIP